jgi:hypothetical protein
MGGPVVPMKSKIDSNSDADLSPYRSKDVFFTAPGSTKFRKISINKFPTPTNRDYSTPI